MHELKISLEIQGAGHEGCGALLGPTPVLQAVSGKSRSMGVHFGRNVDMIWYDRAIWLYDYMAITSSL